MSEERNLRIRAEFSSTGIAELEASVARLRATISSLTEALTSKTAQASAALTSALKAQLADAESGLRRLTSAYIQQYGAIEQFNVRAIAAMRGQADAVKGVARELTEADRILRSGVGRVAYGAVEPQGLNIAVASSAAAHAARQRELDAVFGAVAGSSASAAYGIRGVGTASREAAVGANLATLATRELVVATGEIARGNRGQLISTIGFAMRSLGLGAAASIGALVAVGGAIAVIGGARAAEGMAKLAQETQAAAIASGLSIPQYSQLRGALELMGLKGGEANTALRRFGKSLSEAAENPASRAAQALKNFGFSQDEIRSGSMNVMAALSQLADNMGRFGDNANKAANLELLFGRGFEKILPILNQGSQSLTHLQQRAKELGITLSTEDVRAFEETGQKVKDLAFSIEGSGIGAFRHLKPVVDAVVDSLRSMVTTAGAVVAAIANIGSATTQAENVRTRLLREQAAAEGRPVFGGPGDAGPSRPLTIRQRLAEEARARAGASQNIAETLRMGLGASGPVAETMPIDAIGGGAVTGMQKATEAVAKAKRDAAMATTDLHQLRLNEDRAEIAATTEQIAKAKELGLTGKEVETLQIQLLHEQAALQSATLSAQSRGAAEAKKSEKEVYEGFVADQRNAISEAAGNWNKQIALVKQWEQVASQSHVNVREQVIRLAAAQKEMLSIQEKMIQENIKLASERATGTERGLGLQERVAGLQMRRDEVGHPERLPADTQALVARIQSDTNQIISMWEKVRQAAVAANKPTEALAAAEHIVTAYETMEQKIETLNLKLAENANKIAQEWQKIFTNAFDKIGSSFEGFVDKMFTAQARTVGAHRGIGGHLVTAFDQASVSLGRGLLTDTIKSVGSIGSQAATSLLPGSKPGQGLGDFLGSKASEMFSGLFSKIGINLGTDAAKATLQATETGSAVAIALSPVLAAVVTTPIVTALTGVAGATVAAGANPEIAGFKLERGGIIPSAQGGMITPSGRGVLSVLHPREMVLPANISEGLQGMIRGGNVTASPTYNTSINGRPFMSKGEVEGVLRGGHEVLRSMMANYVRNRYGARV